MIKFILGLCLIITANFAYGNNQPIGVYWGFFDPPTIAHRDIMLQSIEKLNLSELIIIVNDYNDAKNSKIANFSRVKLIKDMLPNNVLDKVTILSQDSDSPISYMAIKQHVESPLYVIAGQDSFDSWMKNKDLSILDNYDQVYVVPRSTLSLKDLPKHKKVAKLSLDNNSNYFAVSSSAVNNAEDLSAVKSMLPKNVLEFLQKELVRAENIN